MKIKYLLVIAVLATAVLGFGPTNVYAAKVTGEGCLTVVSGTNYSIEERISCLQESIAQLMAQIKALQEQQGQGQTWCHTFNTNLRIGDSGSEVLALRTALGNSGFSSEVRSGTGEEFTEQTAAAVVGFQEKYASEILAPYSLKRGTGFVGPSTRAKLNLLYGCGQIPPVETVKEQVKCVFSDSTVEQKCYTADEGASRFSCFGIGTCVVGVYGKKNEQLTWKSSCGSNGGLAYTIIDGQNEYAKFDCGSTTQPSITVLSPNGGETYKNDGGPITINWMTTNVPATQKLDVIRLRAYPNGQEYNLAYSVLNDGNEVIPIPSSVPVGSYTLEIKTYVNNVLVFDASDSYFKIVSITTPIITVISPNGGETWNPGQTKRITWTSSGLSTDAKVNIYIVVQDVTNTGSGSTNYITPDNIAIPASQGYYDWTIIQNQLPYSTSLPHQYKIRVDLMPNDGVNVIRDWSDNSFTISPAVSCTDTDNGKDYYTKGSVSGVGGSGNDYCYIAGVNTVTNILYEGYCDGANAKWETYSCPNGCLNGACIQSTQPSITFTADGMVGPLAVIEGAIPTFVWSATNVVSCSSSGGTSNWAQATRPTSGSVELLNPLQVSALYTITCVSSSGASTSKSIQINVSEAIPPSITVTSPNGGEAWKVGESRQITWSQSGLRNTVAIGLVDFSTNTNGTMCIIDMNINSQTGNNSYQWTAGISRCSQNHTGNYKIIVYEQNSIASTLDYSDNYFTIAAASLACAITDIYSQQITGSVASDIYIKIKNAPAWNNFKVTGAGTYDYVTFAVLTNNTDGSAVLKGSQTFNSAATSYILARKSTIALLDSAGNTICGPIGSTALGANQSAALASISAAILRILGQVGQLISGQ